MQLIGLIDGNNFFVSCERLFRPDLRHRPAVVLSSNDGCIVARSQEVKDKGVPMGAPYFQVKDILKSIDTQVFSSHFTLYRDISSRVFSVVKDNVEAMEQYSIDEAFFTLQADTAADAECQIRELQRTVERLVGIPVSIGVAQTKTQAKYASRVAKKQGGIAVIFPTDWHDVAPQIGIGDIWGVGGRLVVRYKAAQLSTVAEVLAAPASYLQQHFGVGGVRLQAELSGTVAYPLTITATTPKSSIHSRSFRSATTSCAVVKDAVAYHLRNAAEELRQTGLRAGSCTVFARPSRHGDYAWQGFAREVTFIEPTHDTIKLLRTAMDIVDECFQAGIPYQKAGITLGHFVPLHYTQPTLFQAANESPDTHRSPLWQVVDQLNHRWVHPVLEVGVATREKRWLPKRDGVSPAYTTRWSDVPTVRALT